MSFLIDLSKIRALAIDAVGTLIDPEPNVIEVYRAAADRQGIMLESTQVYTRFRSAFKEVFTTGDLTSSEESERTSWRQVVAKSLPELPNPNQAFEELWTHFAQPSSWRIHEDARDLLATAKQHIQKIAVVSNFDARLRTILDSLLPPNTVDHLLISSEIGYKKPHPAFYAATATVLDLPPREILWIGDDPQNDHEAPKVAGFPTFLISRFPHSPAFAQIRFTTGQP